MRFVTLTFAGSLAASMTFGAVAATPSFDCAKAATEVEKTICAVPDLAQADRELAHAYRTALANAPEEAKTLLRTDQRAWIAHIGKICQTRWAPEENGEDYGTSCIGNAYRQQAEFYRENALTSLPGGHGLLLSRQTYRSAPVAKADQIEYLTRIRTEENRFPQFLSPALKTLNAAPPPPSGEDAFATVNGFKASMVAERLLILEETTYTFQGGAHGLYGSEFTTIDLARARKLTGADIFLPRSSWRSLLAREADKALRSIARDQDWEYEPLAAAEMEKAVGETRRWVPGDGFGIYFGLYEVGPYAIGTPVARIPYGTLRDVLTPEFKSLIGLD